MDQVLRANSPVDDFAVLNDVVEDSPSQKISTEMKELAKAGNSRDGKIILDHLQLRVDTFLNQMKVMDVVSVDPITALARVLAAQTIIQEFESVLNDVEVSKNAVADAAKS